MIFHDWIEVEVEASKGVLQLHNDEVNIAIVKEAGVGYASEYGNLIDNPPFEAGDRILFTQHMMWEVDGKKRYFVRGRDVVRKLV